MKNSPSSQPMAENLNPLLVVLPVVGSISSLQSLTSSLFARYEQVSRLIGEQSGQTAPGSPKALSADLRDAQIEAAMLREVLDWLSVRTDDI